MQGDYAFVLMNVNVVCNAFRQDCACKLCGGRVQLIGIVSQNLCCLCLGFRFLRIATWDAALTFNDGSIAPAKILKSLGVKPGQNIVNMLKEVDHNR